MIFALLLTLFFSQQAAQTSPDMTILGLSLGKQLSVPECPRRKIGKTSMYSPSQEMCFERGYGKENDSSPIVDDYLSIKFPVLELPVGTNGNSIGGTIVSGNLEGVVIGTSGLNTQDVWLQRLKEKYGPPTSYSARLVKTRIGASFDTFSAKWVFPDLIVDFDGLHNSLDHGLITIGTKKGAEARERQMKTLMGERRSL